MKNQTQFGKHMLRRHHPHHSSRTSVLPITTLKDKTKGFNQVTGRRSRFNYRNDSISSQQAVSNKSTKLTLNQYVGGQKKNSIKEYLNGGVVYNGFKTVSSTEMKTL